MKNLTAFVAALFLANSSMALAADAAKADEKKTETAPAGKGEHKAGDKDKPAAPAAPKPGADQKTAGGDKQ